VSAAQELSRFVAGGSDSAGDEDGGSLLIPRRFAARLGTALIVGGFLVAGSQLAVWGRSLASAANAHAAIVAPDACTIIPAAHIGTALGAPGSAPVGSLNGGGTSSSCTFTYHGEQLYVEVYPASQYAKSVKVATELWGKPTHPAGLGPKGNYFFSKVGEATVIFVKGPFIGELTTELGPTHAAIYAGAQRLLRLGPVFYADLKA
jgi:hypothetical protein